MDGNEMMVAWESDENSTLDVNHILFEMPVLVLWGRGDGIQMKKRGRRN